jgi:hypothetical protein
MSTCKTKQVATYAGPGLSWAGAVLSCGLTHAQHYQALTGAWVDCGHRQCPCRTYHGRCDKGCDACKEEPSR